MNIAYVTPEFMTSDEKGGLATYIDNISKTKEDLLMFLLKYLQTEDTK